MRVRVLATNLLHCRAQNAHLSGGLSPSRTAREKKKKRTLGEVQDANALLLAPRPRKVLQSPCADATRSSLPPINAHDRLEHRGL